MESTAQTISAATTPSAPSAATTDRDSNQSTFDSLVARLSRQSVDKHHDAYADVAWDSPEMAIDSGDVRFRLPDWEAVARTDWYKSQSTQVQAAFGLARYATAMKVGGEFENVLQRGLLTHAFWLPNGAPEFRYMHHEVIEESQHTLMFQEFINRSGTNVKGLRRDEKIGSGFALRCSKTRPALFFMFVLGGEDPVDYLQRRSLAGTDTHPLLERITRIHLTEEARHLSFARNYLKQTVPKLSFARRHALALFAPLLYGSMARMMVYPRPSLLKAFGVPRQQVRQALRHPDQRAVLAESVAKTRRTCTELGLMTPAAKLLWKACGISADVSAKPASRRRV
jgi:hypothetical protein